MKTILLTGFEPFGGEQINPSWEAVKRFNAIKVDGYTIFIAQLSCTFLQAGNELEQLIEQYQPSIVLNIGLVTKYVRIGQADTCVPSMDLGELK